MPSMSITLKVFCSLVLCIGVAGGAFIALSERSYEDNVRSVASQSLATAERTFHNVEASETSKLGATLTALMSDERTRELYVQRDRDGLYEHGKPVYDDLKQKFGVTNWHFMDVQPEMFVFLRMHDRANHSEVFRHQTAANAIKTQNIATGLELGKFGFALRVVSPYRDRDLKVIGYMEVAEDVARFAATMKAQTGDDYALVAKKELLDRASYELSMSRRNERNAWDDSPGMLVLGSTSSAAGLVRFDADLAALPATGSFIEQIDQGGHVSVRGVFPLMDVSNMSIGGVFVQHDVTALHEQLAAARKQALVTIVGLLVALTATLTILMRRLVFSRLERTMDAATRVVGGDFASPIVPVSDDEVGRLEMLLESFRNVFVATVNEYEQRLSTLTAAGSPPSSDSPPLKPAAEEARPPTNPP